MNKKLEHGLRYICRKSAKLSLVVIQNGAVFVVFNEYDSTAVTIETYEGCYRLTAFVGDKQVAGGIVFDDINELLSLTSGVLGV